MEVNKDEALNKQSKNFIELVIDEDIKNNKNNGRVHTRFPPEPNGYLHIGHAKSICLNFGMALKYKGKCNLRYDDTNPEKEDVEYVDSIEQDVRWLGFDWEDRKFYASDYFSQLYQFAVQLIKDGKAYVCDMSAEEISNNRGTPSKPGLLSPYRNRSVEENLGLFERMKNGEFKEGAKILRAKIDMASPNMHMRDPAIYRIRKAHHHRTGDTWNIYPMYDFAHGLSDSIEGITHSICTLEFEVHRPLYDWFLEQLPVHHPQQIEFARLNLSYTIMSKRKLLELVSEGLVNGWDDPRMPTICGLRRRGYTPEAIRMFADKVGVAKRENVIDAGLLEYCIREDLNKKAKRVMAVMNPLKVVIDNYPENLAEEMDAINNPEDATMGIRKVPFSKVIYIDRDDFMENPPKKYFRLSPGKEVRLRYAYYITCKSVVKDEITGNIKEIHCIYDPATKGGTSPDGRKVQGTIQWVSEANYIKAEVRLYDRLFIKENPDEAEEGKDFKSNLNPVSLTISECYIEPSVKDVKAGDKFQFERVGYFCVDNDTISEERRAKSEEQKLIFNRTVSLKDSWRK